MSIRAAAYHGDHKYSAALCDCAKAIEINPNQRVVSFFKFNLLRVVYSTCIYIFSALAHQPNVCYKLFKEEVRKLPLKEEDKGRNFNSSQFHLCSKSFFFSIINI